MATAQDRVVSYKFSVSLEVPESVKFPVERMTENLHDLIGDSDAIFDGRTLADGHPCIIGTSIGLDGIERTHEWWPPAWAPPKAGNDVGNLKAAKEEFDAVIELSQGIERCIQQLRGFHGEIWEAYNDAMRAQPGVDLEQRREAIRSAVKKVKSLIGTIPPDDADV